MNCPQCGYQWDVSKGSCSRCGFTPRQPNRSEQMANLGAFQTQTAYPDTRFSSQQEARIPTAESIRGEATLSRSQSGSLTRKSSSTGGFSENRLSSGNISSPVSSVEQLSPGTSLRSGRYRLQERLGQQNWRSGIVEVSWLGRDFRYGGAPVVIYEVIVPDARSSAAHSMLRTSTYALLAVGRHSNVPTLQDVFNDQGRTFFVFESSKGKSLQAHLQHLRHPLSEQEVIAFCVQMTEILEMLASQSSPLVHGQIYPEHMYLAYDNSRDGSRYSLSGLSPIIATGIRQLILEAIQTHNSPYTAPEVAQGMIDVRSDLYSLVATAYYAVTGTIPAASGGAIPHAQHFNAAISSDFDAVLAKGLHPVPQQRYQHAAELRQDLLAIRSHAISDNVAARNNANKPAFSPRNNAAFSFASGAQASGVAYPFPIRPNLLNKDEDEDENSVLLPSPEMLPPISEGNAPLEAAAILTVILLSLGIVTALSNFHI